MINSKNREFIILKIFNTLTKIYNKSMQKLSKYK